MKKLTLISVILIACFSAFTSNAQINLWGMTEQGGDSGGGVIFNYNTGNTSYSIEKSFNIPPGDPQYANLIQASDGNFYGMTEYGGLSNLGTIIKCTTAGIVTILHSFTGDGVDGISPYGSLIQGSDGNLYGMTESGGLYEDGAIFKCSTSGVETVLYSFTGGITDGANPYGSLTQASNGTLYGMTYKGGLHDYGTIFSCTTTGTEALLYSFAGVLDGEYPYGSLIQATDGNLYGMTYEGGSHDGGTIFKCTTTGAETQLYTFTGGTTDGAYPYGSLIQATDGNLYGMTGSRGLSNDGTIFKCTTAGIETVLYNFAGGASDGSNPYGSLIQASDGNLYGMANAGGSSGPGTIFKCTTSGTETLLHSFTGGASDGQSPLGSLIQASNGNLYGMTPYGGLFEEGTIFKCTTSGVETILYNLGTNFGELPYGSLIQGTDGNLYGMTEAGGSSGNGTIFRFTTSGAETVLYSFAGGSTDGSNPEGSLIQATDGNLYGMTLYGGSHGAGTIFKCTTAGVETVLYNFAGGFSDGKWPYGSLIQASDGNLYGMTEAGGSSDNEGIIFKCTTAGTETILHVFEEGGFNYQLGADGGFPYGSLIQGSDGNLYGMTVNGGTYNYGAIIKCTTAGVESVLYSFGSGSTDGADPYGSLVQGSDGNLYGMTSHLGGSSSNYGNIFKCTTSGAETILHTFTGYTSDGSSPQGSLIQGSDGNLYGMTYSGGSYGYGTIFECTTAGTESILESLNSTNGATPYYGNLLEVSSPPLSIAPVSNTNIFSVYPNPATSTLSITFNVSENSPCMLEIYDAVGRVISSTSTATLSSGKQVQINVAGLAQGVYFVRMTTADNEAQVVKFIKQ